MGWMEMKVDREVKNVDWVKAQIGFKEDGIKASAEKFSHYEGQRRVDVIYFAIKATQEPVVGKVFCMVVIVESRGRSRAYKILDEFEGPYYPAPPKEVLDKLSPLKSFGFHESRIKLAERFRKGEMAR